MLCPGERLMEFAEVNVPQPEGTVEDTLKLLVAHPDESLFVM
jgi:hypothetical protein